MESFEESVTGSDCIVGQGVSGVHNLEKGAFERGLPENSKSLSDAGNQLQNFSRANLRAPLERNPLENRPVILLIDDEENFRRVLKQVLVNAGYEVIEASNGAEGIRFFYEKPADMIVTDIIMPEKEGIETIIELKTAFPDVKLIAMSGGGWYGTDIDFDMAKKLGARTLDKPFALQELLDVVQELLR
jgi:CheY-like chemotaxis protein